MVWWVLPKGRNAKEVFRRMVDGQLPAEHFARYAAEIRRLVESHPVSEAYLDFPLWSRLDGEFVNQSDLLPRELIALCAAAGIGVEMSLYARSAFTQDGT